MTPFNISCIDKKLLKQVYPFSKSVKEIVGILISNTFPEIFYLINVFRFANDR